MASVCKPTTRGRLAGIPYLQSQQSDVQHVLGMGRGQGCPHHQQDTGFKVQGLPQKQGEGPSRQATRADRAGQSHGRQPHAGAQQVHGVGTGRRLFPRGACPAHCQPSHRVKTGSTSSGPKEQSAVHAWSATKNLRGQILRTQVGSPFLAAVDRLVHGWASPRNRPAPSGRFFLGKRLARDVCQHGR